ncbi:hypothetical protein N7470_008279 [Penicillium chermesinum]|nr:hypothetical protein N7470_008279 [Penicillium chermesinum]
MGKKKHGPTLEELLSRPWCYYCERDFDDLKILTSHQKAKHFRCEPCGRRLNTAGGLSVHMSQVHKEQLTEIDNALPNRSSVDVEIFGMEGIPEDVLQAHNQRVATNFYAAEAERQAATGNPPAGSTGSGRPSKRPKMESKEEIKKRLAEHRAKRQAAASGATPEANSPAANSVGADQSSATTPATSSLRPCTRSRTPSPTEASLLLPLLTRSQPAQSTRAILQLPCKLPQVPRSSPPSGYAGYSGYPPQYPGQPTYGAAPPQFTHPGNGTTPPNLAYPPSFIPSQSTTPQPNGYSTPPGLPQRPSFAAPAAPAAPELNTQPAQQTQAVQQNQPVQQNQQAQQLHEGQPGKATATEADGKAPVPEKAKKRKIRLVYPEQELSPEEKRAMLPKYAYVRPADH